MADMTPITATYTLTVDEFMSACEAHWRARKQGTTRTNLIAGAVGVVAGLLGMPVSTWLGATAMSVGAVLLLLTTLRLILWRRAFRTTRHLGNETSVAFTGDAIDVETVDGRSRLEWSFYRAYRETVGAFLLYTGRAHFSVIPKRAFEPKDVERLARLLGDKLEER
ncbi:MAG: YcxB family protein [Methyloligellaceae bacterium]